jgi:glycerol uptake facilitator protein
VSDRIKRPSLIGELSAEFAGTMILILFGCGVVAQVVTSKGAFGQHDSISWGWGLGVVMGIYTAARISGAHLNPAVTLALAVFRGFEWRKVGPFVIAQALGAFVGGLIVRWNYSEAIAAIDPRHTIATQGIFSTLPGNGTLPIAHWSALRDQIIGTAILLFLILAITDLRNNAPVASIAPFMIGLIVVGIGMAWGTLAGYAINPARDFGPRLASFVTGYGTAFSDQYGYPYFWVPIVGPFIGGLVGAMAYDLFIGRSLPLPPAEREVGEVPIEHPDAGATVDSDQGVRNVPAQAAADAPHRSTGHRPVSP